ncbi:unnamed protein product [Alopecurus aequalis]
MAPVRFSLTFVLLLSGLVVLATIERAEAICTLACVKDTYITCHNKKGQLYGCACRCAPPEGHGCVVHLANGTTITCPKPKS